MSAWIITIGDEILSGRVINWNAYWIAKRLSSMGIKVEKIICIPDDVDIIEKTIREGIKSNITYIFTTGGLGPTPGDVTLEGISKATGRRLELNKKALKYIRARYLELKNLGLVDRSDVDQSRLKMAYTPEGADVVYNDVGVAPGVVITVGSTTIFALPGVPSEAMYLFEKIVPRIRRGAQLEVIEDFIDASDESLIAGILARIRNIYPDVNIKTYPVGFGQRRMKILAIGHSRERILEAIEMLKKSIHDP